MQSPGFTRPSAAGGGEGGVTSTVAVGTDAVTDSVGARTRHVPLMPLVQGVGEPVGSVSWPARCRVLPPLVARKASCWLSNAWAGGFHCSEMQGSRMG